MPHGTTGGLRRPRALNLPHGGTLRYYEDAHTREQAETIAGAGVCPSEGDETPVQAFIIQRSADVAAALAGGPPPVLSPTLKTGQTTAYGTGSDGDLQKGASRSFTDNGDGTITDNVTGLMWEKKSDDGSIHDLDNTYTWGMGFLPYPMDGTMVTTFLAALNSGGGFAGHTDWRIPNVNELQSIANYQNVIPAVDAVFNTSCMAGCAVTTCSCTKPNGYWSSTTYQGSPDNAWDVFFSDGNVSLNSKVGGVHFVRAVRGGL